MHTKQQPSLADLEDDNYTPPTDQVDETKKKVGSEDDSDEDDNDDSDDNSTDDGDQDENPKPKSKAKAKAKGEEDEEESDEDEQEGDEEDDDESDDKGDGDDKGDEESEEDDNSSFWDEVDKLRGEPLEVDYGDIDPVSPEGAALREQAVEDRAIGSFEAQIKQKSPKAYAYLIHNLNGGSDDEFFKETEGLAELPSETDLEADVDKQKAIIQQDLKDKGNTDRQIKAILRAAEEDDELEEMSKEALTSVKTRNDKKLSDIEAKNAKEAKDRQDAITEVVDYVETVAATGKIGNIQIPKADRKKFADAFNAGLRYENGKFLAVTELSKENFEEVMKKEYFQYKKGDLDGLVERKAKTLNTKRLTKTFKKETPKSTRHKTGGLTLGEL